MNKNLTSKYVVASIKRTVRNIAPIRKRKDIINKILAELDEELAQLMLDEEAYEKPIRDLTNCFITQDLIEHKKEIINGKKVVRWIIKYPDTTIPPKTLDLNPEDEQTTKENEIIDGIEVK